MVLRMPRQARLARQPKVEGWFHPLDGDRAEIFLKQTDEKGDVVVKVRASGPGSEMGELIDWFERVTGLQVQLPETAWRRFNRGPRPIVGQETFELSSQDATVPADG